MWGAGFNSDIDSIALLRSPRFLIFDQLHNLTVRDRHIDGLYRLIERLPHFRTFRGGADFAKS